MFTEEVWKDIKGYEGYYQISNYGRVASIQRTFICKDKKPQTRHFMILKPTKEKHGYMLIKLTKNDNHKGFLIHRLVAQAFIPNANNKPEVNHINGNKEDNRVPNLEWVNRSENMRHRIDVLGFKGGMFGKTGKLNPKHKIVIQIKNNKVVREFFGSHEAERITGISSGSIRAACRGEHKSAGGYQWRYKTLEKKS